MTSLVQVRWAEFSGEKEIREKIKRTSIFNFIIIKTVSPKRVVTMVHFMTISGRFLANPFNIFHKTEDLLVILS